MRPLCALALAALLPVTAHADDADDCNQSRNFQLRLTACTALIEATDTIDENRAAAHTNRGRAYFAMGDADKALPDFDRAVELRPDAQSYSNRGSLHFAMRRMDEAQKDFERAVALDPGYADALHNLGLIEMMGGRKQKAVDFFDAALQADPNVANSRRFRAMLNCELGQHDKTVADYRVILAANERAVAEALKMLTERGLLEGPGDGTFDAKADAALVTWVEAGCR